MMSEKLSAHMADSGLSVSELSKRSGYSLGKVSNVKNGHDTKISQVWTIAQAAGLNPAHLFNDSITPGDHHVLSVIKDLPDHKKRALAKLLTELLHK